MNVSHIILPFSIAAKWRKQTFVSCASQSRHDWRTEVVQPMRVGSIFPRLLHKLEVMGGLVGDQTRVLPATVDYIPEPLPRVSLHKELRWDVIHLHHLRAVCKAIHRRHARCHAPGCWHGGKQKRSWDKARVLTGRRFSSHQSVTGMWRSTKTVPVPETLFTVTQFDPLDSMHSLISTPVSNHVSYGQNTGPTSTRDNKQTLSW